MLAYAEWAPHPLLANHVRRYWCLQGRVPADASPWRVLPDGCADALFDVSAHAEARWVGTMTCALDVPRAGVADLFGIRFAPGGMAALVGAPLDGLTDTTADFRAFHLPELAPLREVLAATSRLEDRSRAADRALLGALPRAHPVAPMFRWLEECAVLPDVRTLAARIGTSDRTLERRFLAALGVGPKQHLRYLRFDRARRRLASRARNADVAADLGYVDEAHFIHEFRRFSGRTPAAFRRELSEIYNRAAPEWAKVAP
jgi:AraC-like DNA-binding protein